MANVNRTAPIVAPSANDPYAEVQAQQALAEALAARGNANRGPAPRTSQAALLNGLNDIIAGEASRRAVGRASTAKAGADRVVSDQNRALIQAMLQSKGMEVEGLDAANPGFSLPGKLDPQAPVLAQALSGMDPMAVKGMLAKSVYERTLPDPSQVADREARVAAAQLASDDRREAAAQRERDSIRDAETSRANIASTTATREQIAAQQAETARQLAAMRDSSSTADRELKERLAEQDRALRRQLAEMKIEADRAKAPAQTSQESAQEFLNGIKYDPATDGDEVSELIKNSTGGAAGTLVDKALGVANISTDKGNNVGVLQSRASEAVLDFLGGKLGAGVSNADRDFMMQRAGDIGNSNIPTDRRLAAWNDVKTRMKRAAGAAPVGAGATGSFADPASASPPISALKEGEVTTFANKQSWTLRGGKAVRVQ